METSVSVPLSAAMSSASSACPRPAEGASEGEAERAAAMRRGRRSVAAAAVVVLVAAAAMVGVVVSISQRDGQSPPSGDGGSSTTSAAACSASCSGALVASIDIGARFQTMAGFGASDAWHAHYVGLFWPQAQREAVAQLLFNRTIGIGLSMWRYNIGSGSGGMMDLFPRGAQSFLEMDGTYNWSKPSGQLFFLRRARALGVERVVAFSNSPHRRHSKNGLARASPAGVVGDGIYVLTNAASGRALDGGNAGGNVLQWDKYPNAAKQSWYLFHVEADRYRIANAYWQEQCLCASRTLLGALSLRPCSDTQNTTFSLVRSGLGFNIKLDGSDLYLSLQDNVLGNGDHVRLYTLLPGYETQRWSVSSVSPGGLSPALPAVGKANLRPGAEGAFAQYLVDCVLRLQQEHNITVDYVSPVNEPQYEWNSNGQEGSPWSPAEIVSVARALAARLGGAGASNTKVLVSESAQYKYAVDGDEPAALAGSLAGVRGVAPVFGAHAYFSNLRDYSMWKLRRDLAAKVRAAGLDVWQTEYSMLDEPSKHESLTDVSPILDIHLAVHLAKVILHDLVFADAASWSFWTAMDAERWSQMSRFLLVRLRTPGGSDSPAAWRAGDGVEPAKTLWALGHFSRFVRPGHVRVWHSTNWAGGLGAVAFVNAAASELVEVYVNINKAAAKLDRTSLAASVGAGRRVVASRFFFTDASHDMALMDRQIDLMSPFSILTVVSALA